MAKYIYPDKHDSITYETIHEIEIFPGYWQESENRILKLIKDKITSSNGHFLDVGCGNGRLIDFFEPLFSHIDAIEPDKIRFDAACENIRTKKWRDKVTIKNLTLEEYCPEHTFDFILCSHIIQHIPTRNIVPFIEQLSKFLGQGGQVAILTCHSTINDSYLTVSYRTETGVIEQKIDETRFNQYSMTENYLPIHYFTVEALCKICKKFHLQPEIIQVFHIEKNPALGMQYPDEFINSSPILQSRYGRDMLILLKKH